jgi:hypothetical protein
MVTLQGVLIPVQAPLQPVKVEPALGVALKLTVLPEAKLALHVAPQSIPAGVEVTVPLPMPVLPTVRGYVVEVGLVNVAVTLRAAVMVT